MQVLSDGSKKDSARCKLRLGLRFRLGLRLELGLDQHGKNYQVDTDEVQVLSDGSKKDSARCKLRLGLRG